MPPRYRPKASGFTLVELLVVILIVLLVSAATLPILVPALTHRQVGEAARLLQAALAGARDLAVRAGAPRGIRMLPDPSFFPNVTAPGLSALAYNRFISIEPGPNYSEGRITVRSRPFGTNGLTPWTGGPPLTAAATPVNPPDLWEPPLALRVEQALLDPKTLVPNAPTSWYWNIRRGDQIRLGASGRLYSIVGPVYMANPEQFVNVGPPGIPSPLDVPPGSQTNFVEYLLLTNGQDDNGNGLVDEGFDGYDNNGNGLIDEAFPLAASEWEPESFVGSQYTDPKAAFDNQPYVIYRRPVISLGAREVTLPTDVVIDATTWNAATPERSRLPIDPNSFFVDVMVAPNGQVVQAGANGSYGPQVTMPFYHFWLTEREDVMDGNLATGVPYLLPMPKGEPNYPSASDPNPRFLQADRRLVTLFVKTGQIVTNSIENFNGAYTSLPYVDAQQGTQAEVR